MGPSPSHGRGRPWVSATPASRRFFPHKLIVPNTKCAQRPKNRDVGSKIGLKRAQRPKIRDAGSILDVEEGTADLFGLGEGVYLADVHQPEVRCEGAVDGIAVAGR